MPDRWGYHDAGGFHFWPSIVKAANHYGFTRHDPVYKKRTPYQKGRTNCPCCGLHDAGDRTYPCDVQLARAADIEAEGYPATFCRRCSSAMPTREGQIVPICWHCQDPPKAHQPRVRNGGAYVDDGLGCVEKLPGHVIEELA
jgi:hypothetical protein